MNRVLLAIIGLTCFVDGALLQAAELSVGDLVIVQGSTGDVVVSGNIAGESTVGVTILVEIIGRVGNTGLVTFTPLQSDIVQAGDPWPGAGTFTSFDTMVTGFSATLNGSVDDNGLFEPFAVTFNGSLSGFPVTASLDAEGVWDVVLSTSAGNSDWEGLTTTLLNGTITVSPVGCIIDADCNDGIFCNGVETCVSNNCVAGANPCPGQLCDETGGVCVDCFVDGDCNDSNFCTQDLCNLGTCGNTPTNEGLACDDGNVCSLGETCQLGVCTGGAPPDCTGVGDQCNGASCDPFGLVGNCDTLTPINEGLPCDDGNVCNISETCQGGFCTGGTPPDCSAASGQCNTATCDPLGLEGNCDTNTPVADNTPCDDGNTCNIGETCQLGVCTGGGAPDCSGAGDSCNTASCDPLGLEGNCDTLTPVIDGTSCEDGTFCNGAETCVSGVCQPGSDPCPGQACDEVGRVCFTCQFDSECDDGTFCNGAETCVSGDCLPGADPCVGQLCDETSGSCVGCLTDTDCSDGIFCNGAETCAAGVCQPAGDPCVGQLCDEALDACVECLSDTDCNDGIFCNGVETCSTGSCIAGIDPCPNQLCDEIGQICIPCQLDLECNDGLFCNGMETCVAGSCTAGTDPCAGENCDELTQTCVPDTATLTAESLLLAPGGTDTLIVTGGIPGDSTSGVTILVEIVSRPGNVGTVTFTTAPPVDIVQLGDPWPGAGTYSIFDTNSPGFADSVNGTVDDNGTFVAGPVTFNAPLSGFPVTASPDAGGVWDVFLSTSVGSSSWEGITTTLNFGTITVIPSVGLSVISRAMPPGSVTSFEVVGNIDNKSTIGVTILVEISPREGNTGTLTFTPSPPVDITQIGDPWPGAGEFTPFDTDALGFSEILNASIDDNGTFTAGAVTFSGILTIFPIQTSVDANGTWDIRLATSAGNSSWEGLTNALSHGTIEVFPDACLLDIECIDGNLCTDDSCVSGVCQNINNSIVCDDGDQCTTNDVCTLGNCVGTPVAEGGSCDDGILCTVNDVCNGGVCSGTPLDCSGSDDDCNVGVCNSTTGNCDAVNINENLACDDGDVCTLNDICIAGVCSGTIVDCSSLDSGCQIGTCNTVTGICEPVSRPDGTVCDDGDLCTENDACLSGTCAGTNVDCSALDDGCIVGTCDPATGLCEAVVVNEGDPCNDANLCTANDTCIGGVCAGTPKDCSALDSTCSIGTCNLFNGTCERSSVNEGQLCNDGFICTENDICSSGFCTGTLVGTPGVDVALSPVSPTVQVGDTIQIEILVSSSTCADQPAASLEAIIAWNPVFLQLTGKIDAANSIWNDSEFPDDSQLDGLNAPFGPVPGNDGDAFYLAFAGFTLNEAAFLPATDLVVTTLEFLALDGIVTTQIVIPVSAGFFTKTRVLGAGPAAGVDITGAITPATIQIIECQLGTDCNDGNVCTTDICTNGICSNTNNTVLCDDGIFCTATDTCSNGVCVGSGDTCPGLLCNETLNTCVECLVDNDCVDGDVCTTDTCNALGACVHTNNTAVCNDGLFCTATDQCVTGLCVGSDDRCPGLLCDEPGDRCVECLANVDCDDGNVCTTDSCDVAAGVCVHINNTLFCNDNLFCSTNDTCVNGVCIGTGDPCPGQLCNDILDRCVQCLTNTDCDDGNVCTTDLCNVDTCINPNNTNVCNDGLFCTANDICNLGVCMSVTDTCPGQFCDENRDMCVDCFVDTDCNDLINCTVDTCIFSLGNCEFTPNDTFCDDNLFCNGAETCSTMNGCVLSINPCDDPTLCDEINDLCGCQDPVVIAEGGRFIAVTPADGVTPVALLLTGDPVDPSVSCVSLYVQPDGRLSPDLVFQTPGEWETIHISDVQIIPSTNYVIHADCRDSPTDAENLSNAILSTTWRWGDVNLDLRSDIIDILLIVDGWLGIFDSTTRYNMDLSDCLTDGTVTISDVLRSVDSWLGSAYPCPLPCP